MIIILLFNILNSKIFDPDIYCYILSLKSQILDHDPQLVNFRGATLLFYEKIRALSQI